MTLDDFHKLRIREVMKSELKIINKAVKMCLKPDTHDRFKETIKWNILAILEEIDEIKEAIELYENIERFDQLLDGGKKKKSTEIVIVPETKKPLPYPIIAKDYSLRLLP